MAKWGVALIILSLSMATQARAIDISLEWIGHKNSTHYRMYQSVDTGATWTQAGPDIPQPNPFPPSGTVSVKLENVPEDGLVLFRISARRGSEQVDLLHKGAWYNHLHSPPDAESLVVH